jgi:beta-lactamase regulating signal transducer with metallopeptidase domain
MNLTLLLSGWIAWTILGGAVLLLTHWFNRRVRCASVRHLAWVAAFLCLFLLPMWQAIYRLIHKSTVSAEQVICASVPANLLTAGLLGVGVAGAGWIGLRTVLAWAVVKQWQRGSLPYRSEIYGDQFIGIEVRIAQESSPVVPITWELLRPVVLLPRAAREWHASRMAAVLAHELGHVRRLDNLTQRLALAVCAIHWFNPIFWFAARRMEAEAEVAADDFAILRGVKASSYATELLGIAAQLRSSGWSCPWAQTAMVKAFTLEERLQSIIDPGPRRDAVPMVTRARIAATFAGIAIALLVSTPRLANLIEPSSPAPAHCLVSEGTASTNNGL